MLKNIVVMAIMIALASCSAMHEREISLANNAKLADDACQSDDECLTVKGDCCGCRAGGTQIALSYRSLSEHDKKQLNECEGQICPQFISTHPSCSMKASCLDGNCVLKP